MNSFKLKTFSILIIIFTSIVPDLISQSNDIIKIVDLGKLLENPDKNSLVLKYFSVGDKVNFVDIILNDQSEYFKVSSESLIGFVKSSSFNIAESEFEEKIIQRRKEINSREIENLPIKIREITDRFTFYGKINTAVTPLKPSPEAKGDYYLQLQYNSVINLLGLFGSGNGLIEYYKVEYKGLIGWVNIKEVKLDRSSELFIQYAKIINRPNRTYENIIIGNLKQKPTVSNNPYIGVNNPIFIDSLNNFKTNELIENLSLLTEYYKINDSLDFVFKKEIEEETSLVRKKKGILVEEALKMKYKKLITLESEIIEKKIDKNNLKFDLYYLSILDRQKIYQDSLYAVRIKREDSLGVIRVERLEREKILAGEKTRNAQQKIKQEEARKKEQAIISIAERKKLLEKNFGKEIAIRILDRKVWIGMTEKMLVESSGKPEQINRTVTEYGTRKQYVYGNQQYVYTDNGIVDAIQN